MRVIEFLRQYDIQNRKAERLRREYEKQKSEIDEISSPLGSDGMPHGTNVSKKVENQAVRLADKLLEYEIAKLDALEKRQEVFDVICDVPGIEGDVLYERYVNLKLWAEIEQDLHYSRSQLHRIELKAIKKINMAHNDT